MSDKENEKCYLNWINSELKKLGIFANFSSVEFFL